MRRLRLRMPSAALVALLSIVVGVLFGTRVASMQDRQAARAKIYAQALAAIEGDYVDTLDDHCTEPSVCGPEALIYDSISGMLRTLDPHSSFFSPREFAQMRERQEGHYAGIGIRIARANEGVVVTEVFEGSPANKVGMRRGDVIARVGTEDAKDWTTDDVVARVKGKKGTSVDVTIKRPNIDQPFALTVERDDVLIPTVPAEFIVTPGIGYVRLQDFSETSDTELGDALGKLRTAGMTKLVLDLRDNPGGPLDQAIAVASRFLPLGDVVVSTRGRIPNSDADYKVTRQGGYPDVPLIVLVDRQSASASEIVTGSMQDHDRGLIVGETTFGKSLVQSVFPIANGAGLALTTGRYFTPSHRMIQRPWDSSFDDYETYIYRDQPTPKAHSPSEQAYLTDSGRKVYAGGGIQPDHFIPGTTQGFNPVRFSRLLEDDGRFAGFAERFAKVGDTRPGAVHAPNAYMVSDDWQVTDDMVQQFRAYLGDHVKIDPQTFTTDLPFVKAMIHFEVDSDLFGVEQARRNLAKVDPQLQAALGMFDEATRLLDVHLHRTTAAD